MDNIAIVVGYAVIYAGGMVLAVALLYLAWHTILSLIFLRRMQKAKIFWKTSNPFKRFWYAFTFDADKVGTVFFPGREWKDD